MDDTTDIAYVRSADFTLKKTEELFEQTFLSEHTQLTNQYLLVDNLLNRYYLINESIYQFLSIFDQPKSKAELYATLGNHLTSDPVEKETTDIIDSFFNAMLKKSVLVTVDENERIRSAIETEQQPTEVSFKQYEIIKVFKHIRHLWIGLVRNKYENRADPVVIKKFISEPTASEKEETRRYNLFLLEVDMLKEVSGLPYITRLIDYHAEQKEMVIEYVEGESILSYVSNHPVPLSQKYSLIDKLLQSFVSLQKKGIMHGDIHAGNFIVSADNEPKIIDFGLSNKTELAENEVVKRGGVHYYLPPELISTDAFSFLNKNNKNFTAEVYQLAVLFYAVLYHKLPFNGLTWHELSGAIKNVMPHWSNKTPLGEIIPESVITVLSKAMEKDPERRYSTAEAFLADWRLTTSGENR